MTPVDMLMNKESFNRFYKKYSKAFWFFVCKTCGDSNMADDIFQESFFKFVRNSPAGLNEYQQKAYIYKIAVRLVIDRKRKIKVEQDYLLKHDFTEEKNIDVFLPMDMEKMFDLLKPGERSLMWLAYVEGYSHKEISDIIDVNEKSIKVQLFRIREKFADILRNKGYSGEERHEE